MTELEKAALKMCDYADAQVKNGSIYVLGAQGQTGSQITAAWIKYREHDVESNYDRAIALWKKRLAAGYTALCAYDCSGLVTKWLIDNGYLTSDKSANGLYFDACDAIDKSALKAGDLVFKKYSTKNRMYHVGIYMGDGTVTHSKGRDDGVVRESLSEANWNRYGRLRCFSSAGSSGEYTRLLKLQSPYMSGADVKAVQKELAAKGYKPGSADGSFGPATEAAVKAFQEDHGLEADGIVGPATWKAVFAAETNPGPPEKTDAVYTRLLKLTSKLYMIGDDVKAVQNALIAKGYKPGAADGSYGPATAAAVKAFQKAKGLEADGVVGPKTWAKLIG